MPRQRHDDRRDQDAWKCPLGMARLGVFVMAAVLAWLSAAHAQVTPEQMADMLLNSARKAYSEKNYPFAVARFREFLGKFANHKEVPQARYGLALALIEGPDRDYPAALEQLNALAGAKELAEHPYVLYFQGVCQRGLGIRELAAADAKPAEAPQRRQSANQRFDEAGKSFAAAALTFAARVKPDAKDVPLDAEWAARARCDQAEMLLRTLKIKEALAVTEPFVKDPALARNRYLGLGLYYHGFASFLAGDHQAAGRSLNRLAPFNDPVFGVHARYLLARTHHLTDFLAEAARDYEGVLAEYARQKAAAVEALKRPDLLKNNPDELARVQALVQGPPPDYVAKAAFYWGVLLYEGGKFAESAARFADFPKLYAGSPLVPEAQLRLGFCQVQSKQFAEAIKTLQPIAEKDPRLADQALLWIGKAQVGAADPANAQAYPQQIQAALGTLRAAADRAQQLSAGDPEAKLRRAEILLELADTQQLARQHKEAAATYGQLINEKLLPHRDEELLQRQVAALHLAGDYAASDQVCQRFFQTYPKSPLLPAVLFRHAENAWFTALAVENNPNAPNRAELPKLTEEAARRYQAVIAKFPDFPQVNLARFNLGMILYRRGEYDKARSTLETIPQADRTGDLALTPYLLADCALRLAPATAEDALAAGQLQEQLQGAVAELESFIGALPKSPQTPDALLKLGLCYQRLAGILAQPPERARVLGAGRAAYERLMKDFPQDPLVPQAVLERAKCISLAGDKGGAMNELRRFQQDPLRLAPVAPMAILQLATMLREQNKADEAAKVIADCRQQHEPILVKDPSRASWAALLQYHQGVALREAGKLAEARGLFDVVAKQAAARPEGLDAALRWGQCLQQEGLLAIDAARKRLATPNLKTEEIAQANKQLEDGYKMVRDAAAYFEGQAEQLKQRQPVPETRARLLYEAAWAHRTLAEPEVAAARAKIQQERLKALEGEALKKSPAGKLPAVLAAPEVPLKDVPLQPSEQKARADYQALIASFPDAPLATDARFELAELHAQRDEFEPAVKLLVEAIDKEPRAELTDKIRIRLGAVHAARKDFKSALAQFDAVAGNPKSAQAGQAHYRAGECLMAQEDWAGAAKRLAIFRDQPPYQNLPGLSDRALLRLGHALERLGQWDASRQAHEQVAARFPGSPWLHEARYGMAWAWQNARQYDQAVNLYSQVVAGTATELAARAQLNIGLCRLEQKRYPEAITAFLVVPFTYDYPQWSARALIEAARALAESGQKEQAQKVLERVVQDYPDFAEPARQRLEALKK